MGVVAWASGEMQFRDPCRWIRQNSDVTLLINILNSCEFSYDGRNIN